MQNYETHKVLLIEDDESLGIVLQEHLESKGYEVKLCTNGSEGIDAINNEHFDICILDVMLPKSDGFSVAKNIRSFNTWLPIIFLTAKSMMEDRIEGFKAGGDDYLTKPFSSEELLYRIKAILRRSNRAPVSKKTENEVYEIGNFTFDYHKRSMTFDGKESKITTKEADLLRLLCLNLNSVIRREMALEAIWGNSDFFTARSMDVYITKLRKLLKKDDSVEIMNVHGYGFKLLAPQGDSKEE